MYVSGLGYGASGAITGAAQGASTGAAAGPWGAAIGAVVGAASSLLMGKPSNFMAWAIFDNNAHYTGGGGDKPNANTTGMAASIGQAISQYVAQMEAQGVKFNVPQGFSVSIGQRDPSRIDMPPIKKGSNPVATIGGPNDVNSAVQGVVNWLKQYMVGSPAATQAAMTPAAGGVPMMPTPSVMPQASVGPYPTPYAQSYPAPSAAMPFPSYGAPSGVAQGGMIDLSGVMPYALAGLGLIVFVAMAGDKYQPARQRTVHRRKRRAPRR